MGRVEDARWMRARATDLRRIADRLTVEANTLERGPSGPPPLGGLELRNAAVAVLERLGERASAHSRGVLYVTLLDQIEQHTGRRVRGEKPAATLLANMQRDGRIESVQSRSGRYRLTS